MFLNVKTSFLNISWYLDFGFINKRLGIRSPTNAAGFEMVVNP